MTKTKKTQSPLFRSPIRTLTPEELIHVSGGGPFTENDGKPSQTPIDVEGFR